MESNIINQIGTIWKVVVSLIAAGAAYGELRWRIVRLDRDHAGLKQQLAKKTDVDTCKIVHSQNREHMQMLMDVIKEGNRDIRDDIKSLTTRLDHHITANGK